MSKILKVQVADKVATYLTRQGDIVCGNTDYKIQFLFDSGWDGLPNKTARFTWNGKAHDVEIDENNQAVVPRITRTRVVNVGVYSGDISTTTGATITCLYSIRCDDAELTPENDKYYENLAKKHADRAEQSAEMAQDALSGFVTPQMYGAKGDGVTDDTAAIQQAIDENDVLHIPRGIYLISDSLIVESAGGLHGKQGFLGKNIQGYDAKFIITKDAPAIIVRGYNNLIRDAVCCFAESVEKPRSALIELQSLDANRITQCCNNTFENVRCVSLKNVYIEWQNQRNVYGIGIKLVSDGYNATYQNKFIGCNCADLYKGLVIDSHGKAGTNSNYFGIDFWNCSYMFDGNGNGNTFEGTHQSPWKRFKEPGEDTAEQNVCFRVTGHCNTFHGFTWDCGSWEPDPNANPDNAPYLDISGYGNVFTSSCYASTCRGKLAHNTLKYFPSPGNNHMHSITNTPVAMRGEGGYPTLYAPLTNSLSNSAVNMTLETLDATMVVAPERSAYADAYELVQTAGADTAETEDDKWEWQLAGPPTNIKALTGTDYGKRSLVFNCQKSAKITLKIELPQFTDLESLFIYTTQHRRIPKYIKVRTSNLYFGFSDPTLSGTLGRAEDNLNPTTGEPTKYTEGTPGGYYKHEETGAIYLCTYKSSEEIKVEGTGETQKKDVWGWAKETTREKTFEYTFADSSVRINYDSLGCFNLNLSARGQAADRYVTVEIAMPDNAAGDFGLSYISGSAISKVLGPLVDDATDKNLDALGSRVSALETQVGVNTTTIGNLRPWVNALQNSVNEHHGRLYNAEVAINSLNTALGTNLADLANLVGGEY